MTNVPIIFLFIFLIIVIILLIWLSINTINTSREESNSNPVTSSNDQCVRSTNQLIDISELACCCISGFADDNRYVKELNAVVGPTPVYYLNACAGFCQNGSFNQTTEQCTTGSSDNFLQCVNLTKPINCKGPAMPVAVDNIQLYYIQSATDQTCKISSLCAPNPNSCVIQTT